MKAWPLADSGTHRVRRPLDRISGLPWALTQIRLPASPQSERPAIWRTLPVGSWHGDAGSAEAQFVIARSHGFVTWERLMEQLDRLMRGSDAVESAANAVVAGDEAALRRLLAVNAGLACAKSDREHGATLLMYTSANGVERYRQRTPAKVVQIAEMLLDAGADIEATADVYEQRWTRQKASTLIRCTDHRDDWRQLTKRLACRNFEPFGMSQTGGVMVSIDTVVACSARYREGGGAIRPPTARDPCVAEPL